MATQDDHQDFAKGRILHGRTFQNKNEIYTLPADGVEMERLTRQHRVLTLAINSLYWPQEEVRKVLTPRDGARPRVLDLGSGSGAWAVAMAKEFPHADVLGCDLSPTKPSDAPANCSFQILDLLNDDLSHLQAKFDFVHCRFITLGSEISVEAGLEMYGKDKKEVSLGRIGQEPGSGSWFARVLAKLRDRVIKSSDYYPPGIVSKIPQWLTDEGFIDLQTRQVYIPFSWTGYEDEELENRDEVARLNTLNVREIPTSMKPSFLAVGVPQEEVDLWVKESQTDIDESRIQAGGRSHFFTARAP